MYRGMPLVRAKLVPPRLHSRVLSRERLTRRLLEGLEYRLTVVQAGAGYGKTTALATLAESGYPLVWYHLDPEDADVSVFLRHLVYGLQIRFPDLSEDLLALLDIREESERTFWGSLVDILANELMPHVRSPTLLILDDVHHLNSAPETLNALDRWIDRCPPDLHMVISTRYPLQVPSLARRRAYGEVLEIGEEELAFTSQEIAQLFEKYGVPLEPREVALLADCTEGWAIALQLLWHEWKEGKISVAQALEKSIRPGKPLFDYLAQEFLARQPKEVREFLLFTAVLRDLTPSICDALREATDSARILRDLSEAGLFLVEMGEGHMRYHHLFRRFLYHQHSPEVLQALHRKAALCYQQVGQLEESVEHFLAARAFEEAAHLLGQIGRALVYSGRLDTLMGWLSALPPAMLEQYPVLLTYLGDIARLRSRFDEALQWYQQAERWCRSRGDIRGTGQALRGMARIYLDTVNPRQAEVFLQEALRLSDGLEDRESRARLLELLAENQLNLGRPEEAERLRAQAVLLRAEGPGEAELSVRILLRTGRLDEARYILEERARVEEREPVLRPRAHRETFLLLSLILAFQGEGEKAAEYAVKGTERGQALGSPFVTAVGYMRRGHAWLLKDDPRSYTEACACYQKALGLGDALNVPRLQVEAYWGLCRAHGFHGALDIAQQAAEAGIAIAQQAGDEWIQALIRVSMGASLALAEEYDRATEWILQALRSFQECGDTYGQAVTHLWLSLIAFWTARNSYLKWELSELFRLVSLHGYEYLLTRQTFLGPPDPRAAVPLLLEARSMGIHRSYVERILANLGLTELEFHPGYQLRIHTLGNFRVWRGRQEITPAEWRREKARRLFQILITYRRRLLDRDQIAEILWPEADPESAQRNFKVTMSTLCRLLEPRRKAGTSSAYILRDGTLYGLRPGADIWLDVVEFEKVVAEGDRLLEQDPTAALHWYQQAMALYQGDYLPDALYEDWSLTERERLLSIYLRTATRVAQLLMEQERWEEVIETCQAILACDECWEQAYQFLLVAYARQGNRHQALRVYRQYLQKIPEALGVPPSQVIQDLYHQLLDTSL